MRIVSHNNECKEVLILMQRGHSASPEDIPIAAVEILDDNASQTAEFHFTLHEEREAAAETALPQEIKGYLYEPSPALLKSEDTFTSRPPPCSKAEHSNFRPSASVCGKSPPPPISTLPRHQ